MKVVVTGGAGFIGSNFLLELAKVKLMKTMEVTVIDSCTYASDFERCCGILNTMKFKKTKFIPDDITAMKPETMRAVQEAELIVHFAAESHVDNSIGNAMPFVMSNVVGTQCMLDAARSGLNCRLFMHVSTDEVYGSLGPFEEKSKETSLIKPNSPYSASKASSDLLVRSYIKTHNFPAIITRCCNNFGMFQHEEKLIPKMIKNIVQKKQLPIYGNGENIREWIDVRDHCRAIIHLAEHGTIGEVYNIGSGYELTNNDIVKALCELRKYPKENIVYTEDRKAHDYRYALDTTLLTSTGFELNHTFKKSLKETFNWYLNEYIG